MLYYYGPLSPLHPIWSIYKKMGYTRVRRTIQNQDTPPSRENLLFASTRCFLCFVVYALGTLGLHTNGPLAWSCKGIRPAPTS